MKTMTLALGLFCGIFFSTTQANFNVYHFDDAQHAKRFNQLISDLRCPKCQNNNLADSNAPLAKDIKQYIYQSVQSGQSDADITHFLVSRYGEFITYRPRNPWLWWLPTLISVIALLSALWVIYRQRRGAEKSYANINDIANTNHASNIINTSNANNMPDMASIIRDYEQEKDHE